MKLVVCDEVKVDNIPLLTHSHTCPHLEPTQVAKGLVVYDEVKLDDIPISCDFTQLCAVVFDCQHLSTTNAAQVGGWGCGG